MVSLPPLQPLYFAVSNRPVELLRRNRLDICLGTDSLASNDRLSVFEEMRMFPEVPLPELLSWAAEGGALALDMDDELGEVAPGRRCGLDGHFGTRLRYDASDPGVPDTENPVI